MQNVLKEKEDSCDRFSNGRLLASRRKNDMKFYPSQLLVSNSKQKKILQIPKDVFDKKHEVQEDNVNVDKDDSDQVCTNVINADENVKKEFVDYTVK